MNSVGVYFMFGTRSNMNSLLKVKQNLYQNTKYKRKGITKCEKAVNVEYDSIYDVT